MPATKHLIILFLICGALPGQGALIADHGAVAGFDLIPELYFARIRREFHIFYGHTSHGSQLMSGLGLLAAENATLYARPEFHEIDDDLGEGGDLSWVTPTRAWLEATPACNLVLWSWCGGMSTNSEADVDAYLQAYSQLEADYPAVIFIYITGHLDGSGVDGTLYRGNNRIRDFCRANNKVLFDFADIESWDPAGNHYPDETDACGWCSTWCATEPCPDCGYCAHSHCFNCYLKGKALWWLLAGLQGWESSPTEHPSLGSLKSLFR